MGIKIVGPLLQPALQSHDNPCLNGGWCNNLCLLSPSEKEHSCACPDHFRPQGNNDCASDCAPSQFVCEATYKCLPLWWRCDGQDDCGDGQDELFFKKGACPQPACPPGRYRCLDKAASLAAATNKSEPTAPICLHPTKLCNGAEDCPQVLSLLNFILLLVLFF